MAQCQYQCSIAMSLNSNLLIVNDVYSQLHTYINITISYCSQLAIQVSSYWVAQSDNDFIKDRLYIFGYLGPLTKMVNVLYLIVSLYNCGQLARMFCYQLHVKLLDSSNYFNVFMSQLDYTVNPHLPSGYISITPKVLIKEYINSYSQLLTPTQHFVVLQTPMYVDSRSSPVKY